MFRQKIIQVTDCSCRLIPDGRTDYKIFKTQQTTQKPKSKEMKQKYSLKCKISSQKQQNSKINSANKINDKYQKNSLTSTHNSKITQITQKNDQQKISITHKLQKKKTAQKISVCSPSQSNIRKIDQNNFMTSNITQIQSLSQINFPKTAQGQKKIQKDNRSKRIVRNSHQQLPLQTYMAKQHKILVSNFMNQNNNNGIGYVTQKEQNNMKVDDYYKFTTNPYDMNYANSNNNNINNIKNKQNINSKMRINLINNKRSQYPSYPLVQAKPSKSCNIQSTQLHIHSNPIKQLHKTNPIQHQVPQQYQNNNNIQLFHQSLQKYDKSKNPIKRQLRGTFNQFNQKEYLNIQNDFVVNKNNGNREINDDKNNKIVEKNDNKIGLSNIQTQSRPVSTANHYMSVTNLKYKTKNILLDNNNINNNNTTNNTTNNTNNKNYILNNMNSSKYGNIINNNNNNHNQTITSIDSKTGSLNQIQPMNSRSELYIHKPHLSKTLHNSKQSYHITNSTNLNQSYYKSQFKNQSSIIDNNNNNNQINMNINMNKVNNNNNKITKHYKKYSQYQINRLSNIKTENSLEEESSEEEDLKVWLNQATNMLKEKQEKQNKNKNNNNNTNINNNHNNHNNINNINNKNNIINNKVVIQKINTFNDIMCLKQQCQSLLDQSNEADQSIVIMRYNDFLQQNNKTSQQIPPTTSILQPLNQINLNTFSSEKLKTLQQHTKNKISSLTVSTKPDNNKNKYETNVKKYNNRKEFNGYENQNDYMMGCVNNLKKTVKMNKEYVTNHFNSIQ